jgi:AraC-like DNA-binding protein
MTLAQIAVALNYAEQSVFTRAFRRWSGMLHRRGAKVIAASLGRCPLNFCQPASQILR